MSAGAPLGHWRRFWRQPRAARQRHYHPDRPLNLGPVGTARWWLARLFSQRR